MSTASSLEARVAALERLVGVEDFLLASSDEESRSNSGTSSKALPSEATSVDLDHRLTGLETLWKLTTSKSFNSVFDDATKLLHDVHPGDSLSYRPLSSKNYPILYRRQEVLASADSFKGDMKELQVILSTLLISQNGGGGSDGKIREEQVTQAPVLTEVSVKPQDRARLEEVTSQIGNVQQRAQVLSRRVDSLVDQYHALVTRFSETMVLLDERVERRR